MAELSRIKKAIMDKVSAGQPMLNDKRFSRAQLTTSIDNARSAMDSILPHAVCPYCAGDGCRACENTGWVSEQAYKMAPREMKWKAEP